MSEPDADALSLSDEVALLTANMTLALAQIGALVELLPGPEPLTLLQEVNILAEELSRALLLISALSRRVAILELQQGAL